MFKESTNTLYILAVTYNTPYVELAILLRIYTEKATYTQSSQDGNLRLPERIKTKANNQIKLTLPPPEVSSLAVGVGIRAGDASFSSIVTVKSNVNN